MNGRGINITKLCKGGDFMAIYLDETMKEDDYMIQALDESTIPPWIKKSLIGKVVGDKARKGLIRECKHEKAEYEGKKTCCGKCGSPYESGMGEEWKLKGL